MIIVVVPRVDDGEADFEVFGKSPCRACGQWCWLDEDVFRVIVRKDVTPMCLDCAMVRLNPESYLGTVRDLP